jgi:hypothetical protein
VTIEVLYVHLERPRVIARGMSNLGAARLVFVIEGGDILDTNPGPGARATLASTAKVQSGSISIDGSKLVPSPVSILKAEDIDVVPKAGLHVRDA